MWKTIKHRVRTGRLRKAGLPEWTGAVLAPARSCDDWRVHPLTLHRDSVVYSFGVGDNIAWDLYMIEQYGTVVHAFDPTPESIAWVAAQELPPEFQFYKFGLAAYDGTLEFFPPKKPGRMHYSQDPQKYSRSDEPKFVGEVRRLETIARELGHTHIDVLKMDIEGSEFDAIPELLKSSVTFDQLLVEIHYTYPTRSLEEGLELVDLIRSYGFRCGYVSERGLEFGFLHERILPAATGRRAA